jgi:RNA polymerase sigma-70 factor (ECF subfamily)
MNMAYPHTGSAAAPAKAAARETSSDEMLIERIAQGDQLAMRTLFGRHRVALYRWLLRLVRDEALAEDLLSDVFLDVWRQAAAFEARSSVSTWLLAIARYKALSARRRRADAELDDKVAATVADPADNPGSCSRRKTGPCSCAILGQPVAEHGEVIGLVYYHEVGQRGRGDRGRRRSDGERRCSTPAGNWPRWSARPDRPPSPGYARPPTPAWGFAGSRSTAGKRIRRGRADDSGCKWNKEADGSCAGRQGRGRARLLRRTLPHAFRDLKSSGNASNLSPGASSHAYLPPLVPYACSWWRLTGVDRRGVPSVCRR